MKKRILLVSDMHYTTDVTPEQNTNSEINISPAAGDAFGCTQKQKIEKILNDITTEHKKEKLDMVLVLGDLSIDDYSFRNMSENYCRKFKEECMDKLPCPAYALAGNHDSYPNNLWKKAIGTERQFCVCLDDCVFVMLDNFNNIPAVDASGSRYTKTDVKWLKDVLDEHNGKRIFLCAHMFDIKNESNEFKKLVRSNSNIIALFRGHTHHNESIQLGEEWGNKVLTDIGGYAYNGFLIGNRYTFSIFDEAWAWGYQLLEIDDKITTWQKKTTAKYIAENGEFNLTEKISAKILIG